MPTTFPSIRNHAFGRWLAAGFILSLLAVTLSAISPQPQSRSGDKTSSKTISKSALLKAVKLAAETTNRRERAEMMKLVTQEISVQGLEFQPTPEDENELRAAGASPELLSAMRLKAKEQAEQAELAALRDWRAVKESRQAADFENYLKKHPASEFATLASERAEQLGWEAINVAGKPATLAGLETHLQKYPTGKFAALARERTEQLEWEVIKSSDRITDFEAFLKKYPAGKFTSPARELVEQLEWEAAKSSDKIADFEAHLKKYPAGKFASPARERIEQLDWETIKATNKTADLDTFLQKHPSGKLAGAARERKQQLTASASTSANKPATAGAPQNQATVQPQIVLWTNDETLSRATKRVTPAYPKTARDMRIRGLVKVRVTVLETGKVSLAEVLSGPIQLHAVSEQAALQWLFRPAEIGGAPVKAQGVITFNFTP